MHMTGLRSCALVFAPNFGAPRVIQNGVAAAICEALGVLARLCLTNFSNRNIKEIFIVIKNEVIEQASKYE